jgi:hypothetical protein
LTRATGRVGVLSDGLGTEVTPDGSRELGERCVADLAERPGLRCHISLDPAATDPGDFSLTSRVWGRHLVFRPVIPLRHQRREVRASACMPLFAFRILFTTKDTKSTKGYSTKRLMPSLSLVTLKLITGEPRSHSRSPGSTTHQIPSFVSLRALRGEICIAYPRANMRLWRVATDAE